MTDHSVLTIEFALHYKNPFSNYSTNKVKPSFLIYASNNKIEGKNGVRRNASGRQDLRSIRSQEKTIYLVIYFRISCFLSNHKKISGNILSNCLN